MSIVIVDIIKPNIHEKKNSSVSSETSRICYIIT